MKVSSLINSANFKPLVLKAASFSAIGGNPSLQGPDKAAKGQEEYSFKTVLNQNRKIK